MKEYLNVYTNQAIIYHILHFLGIIPSTYSIAWFVFIAGTALQVYHHKKPTDGSEEHKARLFVLHLAPLLLFTKRTINLKPLIVRLGIYYLYVGSFRKIISVYDDMYDYFKIKW